jgi:hypothetical protein
VKLAELRNVPPKAVGGKKNREQNTGPSNRMAFDERHELVEAGSNCGARHVSQDGSAAVAETENLAGFAEREPAIIAERSIYRSGKGFQPCFATIKSSVRFQTIRPANQ